MKGQEAAGEKKGRNGKRCERTPCKSGTCFRCGMIWNGTFAGTSTGARNLVPVFLVCFFFGFFKLAEFDSRDSARDWQHRLCDFGCVLFCASHWEEYGQSLHLLFPPGRLVRHVTVAANPDPLLPRKGQPASQHSPLVTCQKFVFFFGGVNVGPGLQALQRVYIFPFRDTFIIKKNNNNIAPSMLIHWGQTISFSFSFAARLLQIGVTE